MYLLYASPNSYAMTVHAILEEIDVQYEVRWVDIFVDQPDPEFLAVSPHARVPVLQDDKTILFETGAIALYLAERCEQPRLYVDHTHAQRGQFLQWFHYFASTLQPEVMLQFHPEVYFSEKSQQQALQLASMRRLKKVLQVIDRALMAGPYFMAEQLTVLDFLFAMQATWQELYETSITEYANIERFMRTMLERESVRTTLEAHRIAAKKRGTSSS